MFQDCFCWRADMGIISSKSTS